MGSHVNHVAKHIVQISLSTEVYISVKYCSLQSSCTPLEILCWALIQLTSSNVPRIFMLMLHALKSMKLDLTETLQHTMK